MMYVLVVKIKNNRIKKLTHAILTVLLSICFICMFRHCYLPSSMLGSVIVSLVKIRIRYLFQA